MANLEGCVSSERASKGNQSDTLWIIYILQILKKYSSFEKALSATDVMEYLKKDYSIMIDENWDAQKKKIRRYLHTLHELYSRGCVRKEEGKSRKDGHKWYYDASRDAFADGVGVSHETLSNEEIEFMIDIIAASKIINSESTRGIIKKLLKKTDFSKEKKAKKWRELRGEEWCKSINKELVGLRNRLESYIEESRRIRFDYDGEETILATPYGWDTQNGQYVLIAKVDGQAAGEFSSFLLEKIQNLIPEDIDWDFDDSYDDRQDKEPDDDSSLESLFANIRKIKLAIESKQGIEFRYLSYSIRDTMVVYDGADKRVLPHKLVYADSKYYLIGFDEAKKEIDYYRVDLISQLHASKAPIKISDWDARVLEGLQRAQVVENHPLMLGGRDYPITFKVAESALDRVLDAFGKRPDELHVTKETRSVRNPSGDGFHEERIVRVDVRTSIEEAYRWAMANADVVEVTTQQIRDRIARVADPLFYLYTQSVLDKVRHNLDDIYESGKFHIQRDMEEEVALQTFQRLEANHKTGCVISIHIERESGELGSYLGAFTNTKSLRIVSSPEYRNIAWASSLSEVQLVHISDTQIEDLSCLKEMRKLRQLTIWDSPVSDLSVLKDHTEIHTLDLLNTNISDIRFLEGYQNLMWLSLVGCPIEDYSPLYRLPSYIKRLDIDERAAEKIDVEQLKGRHIGIDICVQKDAQPYGWDDFGHL
jgi:hypothetical protein